MSSKLSERKKQEIREFTSEELAEDEEPLFYALSGSHLYGFPSEKGGDIDIRGFHAVNSEEHLKLDSPREQLEVEKEWDSSFTQSKMDLVSYELKKFGYLVFKTNFNVLEWIFGENIVWNQREEELEELQEIVESHLPADVPYHYRGMAEQNYDKFLNPDSGSYNLSAKKYLYVLRGLLGAKFIQENHELEPDITKMADQLLKKEEKEIIEELIEEKLEKETETASKELREEADKLINDLFDDVEVEADKDDEKLSQQIDDWMLKVRQS
ncbi:MAG: DNA polymerase beta superfamily protein [Candidatus Nanohalobium sp.]